MIIKTDDLDHRAPSLEKFWAHFGAGIGSFCLMLALIGGASALIVPSEDDFVPYAAIAVLEDPFDGCVERENDAPLGDADFALPPATS